MGVVRTLAVIVLAAPLLAGAAAAQDYAATRARSLYEQMRGEECEAALPEARSFWVSRDFAALPAQNRLAFLGALTFCAWQMEDGELAISAARAIRVENPGWSDRILMSLGLAFENDALAVQAFNDLTRSDPGEIPELEEQTVWSLLRAARRSDPSGVAEIRLHDALELYKFESSDAAAAEALRFDHVRALLRAGQVERARARLGDVTIPRNVLVIRVSRLFDPLRSDAALEARLDIAAAAETNLARLRQIAADHPRKLEDIAPVSQALRALGRDEEALSFMDAALAVAEADPAHFEDYADQINWAHNERGYVLYALNRPDAARSAFGAAMAAGEGGEWNVSQVINFASMLEAEGRARDALEVIRTVGRASVFGDMWAASVRACAAAQVNDEALQNEALTFLRANEAENPPALSSALLCVNDLDGVAALYIRRLADPTQSETALLALQRTRQRNSTPLVRNQLMEQRLEQVRGRADVQAAVAAVGRIEDVPLYSVYWGDI